MHRALAKYAKHLEHATGYDPHCEPLFTSQGVRCSKGFTVRTVTVQSDYSSPRSAPASVLGTADGARTVSHAKYVTGSSGTHATPRVCTT